ncbi:hypothetical protein PVAND_007268 [Polypedilum vanderplanki]|uniref:Protein vein n=1 Tax=Polypedilum vanderplanki TaxID=319348 RepID=A0A9J6C6N2_POLVA|nr:hypothetical protein PVAND_007268 [Polypedilum vanderplanki]
MNAHILRRWSPITIFMYLLLTLCTLLVFWCRGATAMHLTPLDFASSSPAPVAIQQQQQQNYFLSLIRNASIHYHDNDKKESQQHQLESNLKLQKLWQMRMREKRARIQAHRKEKLLLQRLSGQHANSNTNLESIKQEVIDHNVLMSHHNNNNTATALTALIMRNDSRENFFDMLNEIRANLSVASNRNRRESRLHHHNNHHMQQQLQHMPLTHNSNKDNNNNINNNNNNNNSNNHRGNRRNRGNRRYCSARDPRTLAFEAPTVFEGKITSMTPDRQQNFSVTVVITHVYKQQPNFKLPKQVRLQFAYKNTSECDIYREEFRLRGFVRDELEQGKIYYFFVKQISLGNFSILGQPIKKISRTAKDVEIGVSENYGKVASVESITPNLTSKEGKRVRIVCKTYGEPCPKVTWFKDGRSINRNKTKYEFVHLRRRSDLIIKSAVASDSGRYECRAKNKLNTKPASKFTSLSVKPTITSDRTIKYPNEGVKECSPNFEGYCLNNGTCLIIDSIGELSCRCLEGFSGKRCEDKTTNITANFELADPYVINRQVAPVSSDDYDDDDR